MEIIERFTARLAVSALFYGSVGAIFLSASPVAEAQATFALASTGCSSFHCNPEATGLELGALPGLNGESLTITNLLADGLNDAGGNAISVPGGDGNIPGYTGCSTDGSNVDCVLQYPTLTANVSVLGFNVGSYSTPTETFAPLPGIGYQYNSNLPRYDQASNIGYIPLIGSDHSTIVADGTHIQRLSQTGNVNNADYGPGIIWQVADVGQVAGMGEDSTRIVAGVNFLQYVTSSGAHDGAVAITYNDVDSKSSATTKPYTYTNILVFDATTGAFISRYPAIASASNAAGISAYVPKATQPISFAPSSPPASHNNSLYYIGYDITSDAAIIEKLDLSVSGFTLSAEQSYGGDSGASPMYYTAVSNPVVPASGNVPTSIILDVPNDLNIHSSLNATTPCGKAYNGVLGVGGVAHRLLMLDPNTLDCLAFHTLPATLMVSPVIDAYNGGIWLWDADEPGAASGSALQHYTLTSSAATQLTNDKTIALEKICTAQWQCGIGPAFSGHLDAVQTAPGTPEYIFSYIGGWEGYGVTKNLALINTADSGSLQWLAPIPLTGAALNIDSGSDATLVTLADGKPGVVFAGGATGSIFVSTGAISLIH